MQRFKLLLRIFGFFILFAFSAMAFAPHPAEATPATACATSGPCFNTSDPTQPNYISIPTITVGHGISTIISILSFVAGVLSVVFLIIGGIRYSTSEGQSQKLAQAKQTITFAVVGLAVSILATLIVDFVIAHGPQ
jgi:type IV secretion system pilin